jgi:hypothetical protein
MTDTFSKINPADPFIFTEQKQSTEVVRNVVTFEEQKVVVKTKVDLEMTVAGDPTDTDSDKTTAGACSARQSLSKTGMRTM